MKAALFSRRQAGGMYTVVEERFTTGNIFWVDSGSATGSDSAGYGQNPDAPFLTLDYAIGNCTANNGDTIYVMPGHAENLGADSAVDVDVAGLRIIGIGWGGSRPTFTATAVAGDFKLASSCNWIENLLFVGGIDATTGMIEVAGTDNTLVDIEYRDVTGQATDVLMFIDGADRCHVDGFKFIGAAAAGANSAISVNGADDLHLENLYIYGNFAVGAIDFRTGASARANIHDAKIWTANAADICIVDTITGSTGFIGPNLQLMLTDNAANITEACTGATFHYIDPIYVCNLAGEKAMLTNITASTDA